MSVAVATAESDSRLIQRVAGGDRDAFTELYRRFARPVLGMAMRQLGDNGRAEEAARQEHEEEERKAAEERRRCAFRPGLGGMGVA